MSNLSLILIILLCLPLLYAVVIYNRLISLNNHLRDAWSNLGTELQRRHELIPNLVTTVRAYANHEQQVLEELVRLRQQCADRQASVAQSSRREGRLSKSLSRVIALSERYPQLKADRHFLSLQQELVNTEDRIQAARRFYNGNVRDYRNVCESFPSLLIARAFGFEAREFFTAHPVAVRPPDLQ